MAPAAPTGLRIAMVGQGNHAIPTDGYAPVEKHIDGLVGALRRRGEDVVLLNRVLPRFKFRLAAHALWVHRQLRRMRPRPDIVHCHSPINARILARLGHPVVFTSHSREWTNAMAARATAELRMHERAYRASRARILLAHAMLASARERLGDDGRPSRVVPNGVDVMRFAPHTPATRKAGKRLLGVGVVARVKRWHLVAQAIQGTDWTFDIVGPLNHPDYAAELAGLPDVRVRGPVSEHELVALLHDATAFAHPSGAEAMSLAVLEAMATGLPVLASEVAGEAVRHGRDGFVVAETDEGTMVRRYRELLATTPASRWAALGTSARDHVVAAHSWDEVARQTCDVYLDALRRDG